ncbi:MAG: hypothetical protein RL741_173, partial [Actinomycetota bacterium]
MNFVTAVKTCFSKYFDGKGRATRPEYWYFYLFYILVVGVASFMSSNSVVLTIAQLAL